MRESAKRKLYKVCIVASRHPHPSSISSKSNPPSPRGRLWALPRHYLLNGNSYRVVVGLTTLWFFIYHLGGVPNWKRALPAKWQFAPRCCRARPMVWCLPHRLSLELGAGPARPQNGNLSYWKKVQKRTKQCLTSDVMFAILISFKNEQYRRPLWEEI